MTYYVQVAEEDGEEPIELPLEDDGTLLLSTLNAQYPGAVGLKFRCETGAVRGVKLSEGKFYFPDEKNFAGSKVYCCVFVKENKRKSDDCTENLVAKTKRMDISKCTDLIVLNLPWEATEGELRAYFETFGELLMAMIKREPSTGKSKGFGFIRFAQYDAQVRALAGNHRIHQRNVTVKIPNSQGSQAQPSPKVFVGRLTEDITADDLKKYFNKYGEVLDVFIPKPFRAFAFVSFLDPYVAQALLGEDHIINGVSVHIGEVIPKSQGGSSAVTSGSSYASSNSDNAHSNRTSIADSCVAEGYRSPKPYGNEGRDKYSVPEKPPAPIHQPPNPTAAAASGLLNALGLNPALVAALNQASWDWMQHQQSCPASVPPPVSSPIPPQPPHVQPSLPVPSSSHECAFASSMRHQYPFRYPEQWWGGGYHASGRQEVHRNSTATDYPSKKGPLGGGNTNTR